MAATRTQVYLTAAQRRQIDERIARDGHSLAWIVREALDQYLAGPTSDREGALNATFGAIPGLAVPPRDEWNRHPSGAMALVPAESRPRSGPATSRRRRG